MTKLGCYEKEKIVWLIVITSAIDAPIMRGNVATTTKAMRQLSTNAITNAVTVRATFWTIVDILSASALLTNVASAAKDEVRNPLLLSSKSNHPISFFRIAAAAQKKIKNKKYESHKFHRIC